MADKPKLLWHSNAPFSTTGYGAQTGLFIQHINQHYDLAVSAFFGLEGARLRYVDDIHVYPGMSETFGNEAIHGHARHHFKSKNLRDGLVVTLMDVWVLDPSIWRQMNVACWVPVDHQPTPPRVMEFFEQSGAVPIAMSKFGRQQLQALNPLYVPHAVDTSLFKPYDRSESRELLSLSDDEFVVGVVAANKGWPSRKSFPEIVMAFAEFRKRHSDAKLLLHTDMRGRYNGVNLAAMLNALKVPPESVVASDQYRLEFDPLSPELMGRVYSGMDVLLNPSKGEGFGIPILEAQACGVPVVVNDFSAMSELCGAGWKLEADREWSPQASWWVSTRVEEVVDALNRAYSMPKAAREQVSAKAVEFAQDYDVHKVLERDMLPALAAARERFEDRKPAPVDVVARSRKKHGHKVGAA